MNLTDRLAWQERAACAGKPTDWWFPGKGESHDAARSLCASCPVRAECLEYGLNEKWGVFGGLCPKQRRELRRERRRRAAA